MTPDSKAASKRPTAARCSAIKRNGGPCQAIAGSDGLCSIHGGRQDPRELGQKGGRGRTRNQDGAVAASEKGRAKLLELIQSDDPKVAISAARALFSYGPQKPPAEEQASRQNEAHWWQFARRLEAEGLVRNGCIEREGERTFLTWEPLDVQGSIDKTLPGFLIELEKAGIIRAGPVVTNELRSRCKRDATAGERD